VDMEGGGGRGLLGFEIGDPGKSGWRGGGLTGGMEVPVELTRRIKGSTSARSLKGFLALGA
jgi:hypothetical protein